MSYGGSWSHGKVRDYHILHNTAEQDGGDAPFPLDSPEDIEGTWQYNITKGLAIRMSSAGISTVTKDNIETLYLRCRMTDEVLGCVLTKYDETRERNKMVGYHLTLEDIERRVGLWASTDKKLTDAGFKKKIADEIEHRVKRATSTERKRYNSERKQEVEA